MPLQLHYVTHSEVGLVRKNNQDSGYASARLLVVADGMGGAAAGDLASAVAIDTIRTISSPAAGPEMLPVLTNAIGQANDRIADLVEADYSLEGMGTTVTGVLFDGSAFGLAHIGDSRAYLMRDGLLERLTHDHSWVQSLVDEGKITEDEATVHPHRSLLLKVLNGQPANEPDTSMIPVQAGDRLMLCSDGLCGLVDDPVIAAAMQRPAIDDAIRELVDEALAEGGIDNITVIVADVVEAGGNEEPYVLGAANERAIPAVASRSSLEDLLAVEPDEPTTATEDGANEDTIVTRRPSEPTEPHEDEARYNPQPPHRRRLVRPLIGVLVLLLVAGAALSAGYAWTRTQYFVGVSGAKVAIFKGLPDPVPGVGLSSVYEVQPLNVADLPPYYQERLRADIEVASLAGARQTVAELTEAVRRCATQKPKPAASTSATPRPSQTPSTGTSTASAVKPPSTPTPVPSPRRPTASATASPDPGSSC